MAGFYVPRMYPWAKRLNDSVEKKGWTKAELSRRSDVSYDSVNKYMRGDVEKPRGNIIEKLAKALGVTSEWLLIGNTDAATVPVIGYVGAGAEFDFIDDYEKGAGFDTVEAPPGTPRNAVAVMVRGKSEYPIHNDGDILLYWNIRYDVESFLNIRCVCRLADGRTVIKTPTRGSAKGLFTLISFNAPPIEDIVLEWCAKIEWVKPR